MIFPSKFHSFIKLRDLPLLATYISKVRNKTDHTQPKVLV